MTRPIAKGWSAEKASSEKRGKGVRWSCGMQRVASGSRDRGSTPAGGLLKHSDAKKGERACATKIVEREMRAKCERERDEE